MFPTPGLPSRPQVRLPLSEPAGSKRAIAELEASSHQHTSHLWFVRVQAAAGLIVLWAAAGYASSWALLGADTLAARDSVRVSRAVVTCAAGMCVMVSYPLDGHARRARISAVHMCLLFAAIGLHFVLLLSEAGGSGSNVAQIDLSLRAAGRRADALTTAQALVVFGVPLAFFYLAIFSLFAHAIALYAQRLAERDALAKELLAEELRKPQDAALLRHIDELFRRGQISQEDYVMRRTALLNALQPKPLTVAERLRLVDELRKEGAITEDEYAQKRNDLLNSV